MSCVWSVRHPVAHPGSEAPEYFTFAVGFAMFRLTFRPPFPSLAPRQLALWILILLPFPIALPLAFWVTHSKARPE